MKTFTVKKPVQMMEGGFDDARGRNRQYIPVPLKFAEGGTPSALMQAAVDAAGDMHGSGIPIDKDLDETCYMILVENGRYLPPGAWIITYWYHPADGCRDHELFLAAEIL